MSPTTADDLAFPALSDIASPRKLPSYRRARAKFLAWQLRADPDLAVDESLYFRRLIQYRAFSRAKLYYGSSDFCDLVTGAMEAEQPNWENDGWLKIEEKSPLFSPGLLYFEKPIPVSKMRKVFSRGDVTRDVPFRMVVWTGVPGDVAVAAGVGDADVPRPLRDLYLDGVLAAMWLADAVAGEGTGRVFSALSMGGDEMSVIGSILGNPGIVEVETVKQHPTERRKAKEAKRPLDPEVRVINLRHAVAKGMADATAAERTYKHRWIVRGHWRNQACGPGHREHRPLYVAPYLKGPEAAPLLTGEKVYKW